jgi:uncharacterized membrane protein YbhN (UPF0104 family)
VTGAGSGRGVGAPATLLSRRVRLFASPAGAPRSRRTTDLVLLVVCALALLVAIAAYPPSGFERSLERFLTSFPGWLDPLWGFLTDLVWLLALVLVGAALVRRRFAVVAQALGGVALALLLGLASVRLASGGWPEIGATVFGTTEAPRFPSVRLAEAAAVLITVSPHLVRPWRRFLHWALALAVLGTAAAGGATPYGAGAALLIGAVAACGVRLVGGTSAGRPGLQDVESALVELGVPFRALDVAPRQVAGVFHVSGVHEDGRPLLVKVYGRDAHDTQLVAALWRAVWYQSDGDPLRLGRLHAAEHEALVTLLARGQDVPTWDVVTAAATIDDDAVLVLRGEAVPLAARAGEITDEELHQAWRVVSILDRSRIAHRQIDTSALALVDGRVGLVGFGRATLAPESAQLLTDRAQLLLTLAALVGEERALASAQAALGDDGLGALLPYLQVPASGPALRRELKAAGIDPDAVRVAAARRTGVEPPEPVQLRRVTWWSAVQLALLALASYTIVDAASGVDWDEVRSSVRDASWGWLVAGLAAAQLPRLTQALTTIGSVPVSLPFGLVYTMQLAMGYMNVALPSNLARMAVNIRFFQRQGLSPPVAVASGAIDSFVGTVVQAVLLGVLLLFSESSLELELPFPSGGVRTLLWLLLAALVASVLVVTLVRRIRSAIVERVRLWWPDVRATLGGLRASHKLALLLFGSVGTEILFALTLGLFAQGFGYDVSLAELLVINIGVSLLASFVPVPGGVGVAEFGLTLGLTSAGMTPEAAIAAVLLYRIATFYLPPTWGFLALQWLQRNRYL